MLAWRMTNFNLRAALTAVVHQKSLQMVLNCGKCGTRRLVAHRQAYNAFHHTFEDFLDWR